MARRAHLIGPVKMLVRIGLHDGIGKIGTETTINSGDIAGILMIAVQALEKRTAELQETKSQLAVLAA
jgi:hypothetical protein